MTIRIPISSISRLTLLSTLFCLAHGCGDDGDGYTTVLGLPGGDSPAAAKPAADIADAGVEEPEEKPTEQFTDEQFVELDIQNRDPFRSFAEQFKVLASVTAQRKVLMGDASIDEMRLVAIVMGGDRPRAMLTDPGGVGHVVKRGDFIGRPEVVQVGGEEAMTITLNWRVDRIRPTALVLTREDPTDPERPPLTRVMPLHDEEDASR